MKATFIIFVGLILSAQSWAWNKSCGAEVVLPYSVSKEAAIEAARNEVVFQSCYIEAISSCNAQKNGHLENGLEGVVQCSASDALYSFEMDDTRLRDKVVGWCHLDVSCSDEAS